MKILITGSEGNIGTCLKKFLFHKYDIYTLEKSQLDITNKDKAVNTIISIKPDLVIHTAALTNIDLCERHESEAYKVNTLGSLNIAYACSILDIPIMYISTSYVFDGIKSGPYYETDECNPLNVYGKTKLAGEKLIRTICKKYFIIRTSWVFGGEDCLVKSIIKNKDAPIFITSNEISNPTYMLDLCNCIEKIMVSDLYGVYNCVNSEPVSKYLWVKSILDALQTNRELITLQEDYVSNATRRPQNSSLNTVLIKNCFNVELQSWKDRLKVYVKSM